MTDLARREVTQHQCLAHRIDPQFSGAAVVVDFVAAVGAEEVVGRVRAEGIAVRIERRAVWPDDVVIDEGVAVGASEAQAPVLAEAALKARIQR